MKYKPYDYQLHATEHIIDNPGAGLFLDMGLGKTVTTLTAIDQLMNDRCEISRVLVIAPKKVAENTWSTECAKWDHLKHLRISLVLGSEKQRLMALRTKAEIYVINRENVVWLVNQYNHGFPFDLVVVDELSSFKSAKSARFKALRRVRPLIARVVGLTGTPAPNGLMDLWSQVYLLDQGERLEKTITAYRTKYFEPGDRNGQVVFNYRLKGKLDKDERDVLGADYYEKKIYNRVADICISMKAEDYLKLPDRMERDRVINFPAPVREKYHDFERKQILALQDTEEITAVNAAALTGKLQQFANGAVYDDERNWHVVHDEKLDTLEEIVDVAGGNPVLVFYQFQHDLARINERLKAYKPRKLDKPADVDAWNRGEITVALAHPASAGHGLNLQAGGHVIVWFGLPWSLELYQQANARLLRQGQEAAAVIIHRLIAAGTVDEDILAALDRKTNTQEALLAAVKARVKKYLLTV